MIRLDDAQSNVEVVVSSQGKNTSLRAGYVVVTLPLGVLKSRLVSEEQIYRDHLNNVHHVCSVPFAGLL